MKKLSIFLAGALALAMVAFTLPLVNIVGHWRVYHKSGMKSYVDFKADGSYQALTDEGHEYVSGKYTSKEDVVSITDNLCGIGYIASYKINSFGKDSVVVTALEDTCSGRKESVDGASMKRLSKK